MEEFGYRVLVLNRAVVSGVGWAALHFVYSRKGLLIPCRGVALCKGAPQQGVHVIKQHVHSYQPGVDFHPGPRALQQFDADRVQARRCPVARGAKRRLHLLPHCQDAC